MRLTALFARFVLFLSLLLTPAICFAHEEDGADIKDNDSAKAKVDPPASTEKQEGFNAGEMIMEHISDNHEWHVYGKTWIIPLPVIVKTDKGIECFSSSNFHDPVTYDLKSYAGKYYTYKLNEEGKIVVWDDLNNAENEIATKSLLDVSITKNVVTLFIVVLLMFFVFFSVAKTYKKRVGQTTKGMQSLIEPLVVFVRDDIAKTSIGPKYERYLPFLLTIFFFIWISNLLGLIPIFPGGANFSGNITITASLALLTFIITMASSKGYYWRHIFAMPGVPIGVLVILTPIEIMGVFLKPFILMIRLFANITAGHIIALSFYCLIFIFAKNGEAAGAGFGVSVGSVAFCIFMMFLELLVGFLQAYVFTLLSAIYFGSALEEHHHEHNEEHAAVAAH
jgi:F-type H+-transporting ATPase subunit a